MIQVIFSDRNSQIRPVLVCDFCEKTIFHYSVALIGWQIEDGQVVDGRVVCLHIGCKRNFEARTKQWISGRSWQWLPCRDFFWLMNDCLGLIGLKKVSGYRRCHSSRRKK